MAAERAEEVQRRRRRKRLAQGLLLGGTAVGLPALANALISRRASKPQPPQWGRVHRYAWKRGEIVFQQLGGGAPLLLLHSLGPGHSANEWRRAAEILAAGFRVYAPDLLGWGRSAKPTLPYDAELYIQLVKDFLRDVVGQQALVAAAGLPAAYAVQVAADEPESVGALALVVPQGVEGGGKKPEIKDALVHRLLRLPVLGTSALNVFTSRSGIGHHLRTEVYAAPERVDAALVEDHYQVSHQRGAHIALAAYLAGHLAHGVEEALAALRAPVWLAWGRHAESPPVETADLWLHHLTAELEIFEDSGSQPHAEQPGAFCRALAEFLKTLPG